MYSKYLKGTYFCPGSFEKYFVYCGVKSIQVMYKDYFMYNIYILKNVCTLIKRLKLKRIPGGEFKKKTNIVELIR